MVDAKATGLQGTGSYRFPGDFILESLDYVNRDGEVFGLNVLYESVDIYQCIYQPFMKCEIAINDSAGFINEQPQSVVGGEIIYIAFKTSDPTMEVIRLAFLVNSIIARKRTSIGREQYIIEAYSAEHFMSIDRKISRAYGYPAGLKVSEIVQSIHDEYMNTEVIRNIYRFLSQNERKVNKENYSVVRNDLTTGLHQCTFPNVNPIQAIRYLQKSAVSSDTASLFYYYENFKGFHFKSLEQLVTEDAVFDEYEYYPSAQNTDSYKSGQNHFFIKEMERVKDVDMTANMSAGLYASTMIEIDPLRKDFNRITFDYENESFETLNKLKVPGGAKSDAVIHLKTSRRGHDTDSFFNSESPISSRDVLKDQKRASYLRQITNSVIRLTLYGNSDINVGDTIECVFHNATSFEAGKEEDKYTSGKYLITDARHKIGKTDYLTIIECVKDTGTKERTANAYIGASKAQ